MWSIKLSVSNALTGYNFQSCKTIHNDQPHLINRNAAVQRGEITGPSYLSPVYISRKDRRSETVTSSHPEIAMLLGKQI